jgi:hypothetical protein
MIKIVCGLYTLPTCTSIVQRELSTLFLFEKSSQACQYVLDYGVIPEILLRNIVVCDKKTTTSQTPVLYTRNLKE